MPMLATAISPPNRRLGYWQRQIFGKAKVTVTAASTAPSLWSWRWLASPEGRSTATTGAVARFTAATSTS